MHELFTQGIITSLSHLYFVGDLGDAVTTEAGDLGCPVELIWNTNFPKLIQVILGSALKCDQVTVLTGLPI